MKRVLALLLTFVFLQAQTYALSGGPDYGSSTVITGIYAGVMIEKVISGQASNASVAIFTLTIPASGYSTGDALIFSTGRIYTGTITGVSEAGDSNTFKGIVDASYNYTLTRTIQTGQDDNGNPIFDQVSTDVTATTNGPIKCEIFNQKNGISTSTLLQGEAILQVANGFVNPNTGALVISDTITYSVSGFRQTAAAA